MIIYQNDATGFIDDVDTNRITDKISEKYTSEFGRKVNDSERRSWNNSMQFMGKAVRRANIDGSAGILIEYNLPSSLYRIDFVIAGEDAHGKKNFVIVELKQWERAEATTREGVVRTIINRGERQTTHPSYQANSYKSFLSDYNENVYMGDVSVYSCAYLHNYTEQNPEPLKQEIYQKIISESPLFLKDDFQKLEDFMKKYVSKGKGKDVLYQIDSGKVRPSKKLIDYIGSIYKGNEEFHLLEDQKVAYETALDIAVNAKKKTVVIIKGGPGTGKSVISMNLIPGMLKQELNTVFVAPNAAFRSVMQDKLVAQAKISKSSISHLFKGSSGFVDSKPDTFDAVIVDEAHRLKNGTQYMYKGENQVEDIVNAARVSVFFVDDNQMVRPSDIGSVAEVKRVAAKFGANVEEMQLTAQFRCSGAEGYVNWLDDVLHIQQTGNYAGWSDEDFEFKIFDNPNILYEKIKQKQSEGHFARLLAGYAWRWTSAKNGNGDGQVEDVEIPEYDFKLPWNSRNSGTTWAIDPKGVEEIGCIHTSQGLEFDYIGVIVGNEFRFDPETMEYHVDWDSYKDSAGKQNLRDKPEELTRLVKNIYKTLMSRGMKGCYVYFMDKNLEEYFRDRL